MVWRVRGAISIQWQTTAIAMGTAKAISLCVTRDKAYSTMLEASICVGELDHLITTPQTNARTKEEMRYFLKYSVNVAGKCVICRFRYIFIRLSETYYVNFIQFKAFNKTLIDFSYFFSYVFLCGLQSNHSVISDGHWPELIYYHI